MNNKIQYLTKQEWLYNSLKIAIRSCDLKPGQRLVLDEIAAEYGVSRIPVREALLQLQNEGLVHMTPHSGAVVSEISFASAKDYFAVERELQVLATRAAALRRTGEDCEELKSFITQMESAAAADDTATYSALNHQFHDCIAKISRLPLVPHFMEEFQQHWERIENYYGLKQMSRQRMLETINEHREIVKAILAGDEDAVEDASRKHNITGLDDHLTRMAEKS